MILKIEYSPSDVHCEDNQTMIFARMEYRNLSTDKSENHRLIDDIIYHLPESYVKDLLQSVQEQIHAKITDDLGFLHTPQGWDKAETSVPE